MSVKSFKFVSPGVFINEIDNSFIPKSANAIGPVVIGRATRGLSMTPVQVESYSQFVEMFGPTVPGNGGGDIYRDGNYQSPMYGTYAAKAFLNANVAPLTFVRLLGEQHGSYIIGSGENGWKTTKNVATTLKENGGAYGLWIFPSSSALRTMGSLGTASLAGVWYANSSSAFRLSGALAGTTSTAYTNTTSALGAVIKSDTNNLFTIEVSSITGSSTVVEKIKFGFDDTQDNFIRKVFNTNPQLSTSPGTFYPAASYKPYWLGETFEQELRDGVNVGAAASVVMSAVTSGDQGIPVTDGNQTGSSLTLVDHVGKSVVYQFVSGATDGTMLSPTTLNASGGPKLFATGSATALAARLVTAINGATGHNGTVKAVESPAGTVQLFQNKGGTAGNKTTTLTQVDSQTSPNAQSVASAASFTGGTGTPLVGGGTAVIGAASYGVLLPIANTAATGPHNMEGVAARPEAKAGWFIGQHQGTPGDYYPPSTQKLFRLKGRGHGEWLQRNVKVSIEKIRASNTKTNPYGSFSIVLRALKDTDSKVTVLERFDGLNLNPSSPDYIARRIGDKYAEWDSANRIVKAYGEYGNLSKFVYVEMNNAVDGGASGLEALLPFGYFGPPKFKDTHWNGELASNTFISGATLKFNGMPYGTRVGGGLSGSTAVDSDTNPFTSIFGQFNFPKNRLRLSASDGGLTDQTNAYFGFTNTRTSDSTIPDASVADFHRMLYAGASDNPVGGATGLDGYSYVFSLDDIQRSATTDKTMYYNSGSRKAGNSVTSGSYTDLLNKGYDRFTAPFWGGFDGFDITKPDPLYNSGMTAGSTTELNSYIYNTWKRAIDTVADPEALDINMLVAPGLTFDALTGHMINICEERADALALIDLKNVYTPAHEAYNSSKKERLGSGATSVANSLRDRQLDSSYGATFYPWVQTRDEQTGRMLWIPPSVAMAGVLASSQAKSDVWFAPAGFNRGGLSDGAAGIPITGVIERLTSKDRDTLYEARINPIASFPSSGIVVFGQKTLQERSSALDRINVRRLVIYLKKQISVLSTQVLFEQNVQATWNRFKSLIEPFLANVKVQFGITDYKLILDETTTTPDLIDQNILYAKIMVKPARAIEYIAIDFVIASTGASFDD